MTNELTDLERMLQTQAHAFAAHADRSDEARTRTYLVLDAEYQYDRDNHRAYGTADGASAESKIRWPFHHLAALAWCLLRIEPGAGTPVIAETRVMTLETATEPEMAAELFALLSADPTLVVTTWGGETKDIAVLRRIAAVEGLVLPVQLTDLSPLSGRRIDLCNEVSVRAESVHLPEYAWACSIPSKPSQSKGIGKLVEQERWSAVAEQVLGDVAATAIILLRHLASRGAPAIDPVESVAVLVDVMLAAQPCSDFLRTTVRPWAQRNKRSVSLKGVVYRAA